MILDARKINVIKKEIENYKFMKEELEQRIAKNDTLEELSDFINKFRDTEITNLEKNEDYGYLDFLYKGVNMCVSWEKSKGIYVSKCFEIYDSKEEEYIVEDFLTIEEYEKLMNTPKEDMLRDAVADLKFYDAHDLKQNYEKTLEKIIVFLKEEF